MAILIVTQMGIGMKKEHREGEKIMVIYRVYEITEGPNDCSYALGVAKCYSYYATKNEALKAIREGGYKPSQKNYPEIEKLELGNKADFVELLNRA